KLCMHCNDPACASACPVGAIKKTPLGPVVYDAGKCIGCRYCMLACPYSVPRYQWAKLAPYVKKCDLCAERVKAGRQPACTEACPVQASIFGERDALITEAWSRIRSDASYVPRIYGVEEAGGGSVLFVSDVEFEKLGFKPLPTGSQPVPTLTASAMGDSPKVVIMGGSILAALYWITQRRRDVAMAEAAEKPGNPASGERN
ncbi:MAG TPA: 4Fe-4S dicluster domain-containing protein, partial [Candidatus Bathyarchaeia archaeon]|nr:4Fe-4S dicluster domain-containing protein [Candidatus Bathyarchaeia archaeon]